MTSLPTQLKTDGYVVINIADYNVAFVRENLQKSIQEFNEFETDVTDRLPIGGFGVFGNPSSFHHPYIRHLRDVSYEACSPILREAFPDMKLEVLFDRLMCRRANTSPGKETWHRDEAKNALKDDVIIGGWWNFDDHDSFFSCVPGTHTTQSNHSGFGKIKDKDLIQSYEHSKKSVIIPPGHIILFYENIVHEVCARKMSYDSYRLFLAWRMTHSNQPLISNLDEILNDQAIVPVKSGQMPHMWTKMHWIHWRRLLTDYSKKFKQQCCSLTTMKTGVDKGKYFMVVHPSMKSLRHYELPLYKSYSSRERAKYFPH